MAESAASEALRVGVTATLHKVDFYISTGHFELAGEQPTELTHVGFGVTFSGSYRLLRPIIEGAVKRVLGSERDDQRDPDIKLDSLSVLLHCLTDERFLEVLEDYESGNMNYRLHQEFSKAGIKVTGLMIEIKKMEKVYRTKEALNCKRYV